MDYNWVAIQVEAADLQESYGNQQSDGYESEFLQDGKGDGWIWSKCQFFVNYVCFFG